MIPLTSQSGKRIAVFGLARSGLACVEALRRGGATALAWDDAPAARARAQAAGHDLTDLQEQDFESLDALVLSPGVPLTHPEPHWTVMKAKAAGLEVIGDTELFVRELAHIETGARLVAITGTNGKSTTTALLGHVLASAGRDAQIGGNIGTAVLALAPPGENTVYVVEFSSYQIELTPGLRPDVGMLLNLAPDHLDRHGSMERYSAVKAQIFANQGKRDSAVIGVDDAHCRAIAESLESRTARRIPISAAHTLKDGIFAEDGTLYEAENGAPRRACVFDGIASLRGRHNGQNAAAAAAAALALGLTWGEIEAGLKSFPGLAHRMQPVARLGPVLFVNDSKATNAEAAEKALSSYERIFWIAGGRAKQGGIADLKALFPKIVKTYLIGEAAEDFARTLDGEVETEISGAIETAVAHAAKDAAKFAAGSGGEEGGETVVLLSPACASFDQFADFEARGLAFRDAVACLDGVSMI